MEDIQEEPSNLNADFLATHPILSDDQMNFIFSDFVVPENEVFDMLNQIDHNDDELDIDELDMILDNFKEFDDFQFENLDSPHVLTPSSVAESSPQTSELDFNNEAVLGDFAKLPEGYTTPDLPLECATNESCDPWDTAELTVIPKMSIVLQQDPKSLTQRQKLIDSCIGNRKTCVTPKGRPIRGRSILKPLTMRKEVYSKIPSYFTSIAPVDKIKETPNTSTSCKENIYDKLPPYLTDFVNIKNIENLPNQQTSRVEIKTEAPSLLSESNKNNLETNQTYSQTNVKSDEERKLVDERRVLHVGNIKRGTTREQLYVRFKKFGPIDEIKLHYRDEGDCFAFITYKYTTDAFDALEHGNDCQPQFELSLGGRRLFCLQRYSDLDSAAVSRSTVSQRNSEFHNGSQLDTDSPCILSSQSGKQKFGRISSQSHDFDSLLKAAKSNIRITNQN